MNELKNDGGYAFPVWELNGKGQPEMTEFGMTLRDWFAGRVCSALMTMTSADTDFPNLDYQRHPDSLPYAERVARISYQIADAMLKEREPETDTYVLVVPNKCDRIVWRGSYYHLPLQAEQHAAHPAITHCDNCGCDWLDNGLNPVGCPYCKNSGAELQPIVSSLAEALEMMVEMVEMNGFGRDYAMDVARAALDAYRMVKEASNE